MAARRQVAVVRPSDFLSHDMTPIDNKVAVASTSPLYEPSSGDPVRNFRKVEVVQRHDYERTLDPSPEKPARIPKVKESRAPVEQPGDFFSGHFNRKPERNRDIVPLYERFDDEETFKKRVEQKQSSRQELLAVEKEERKRFEEKRVKEHREYKEQTQMPDVEIFGSPPSIVPDPEAGERLYIPPQVSKGKHHSDGPSDAYAAANFGKVGPGGPPPKNNKGDIEGKKTNWIATKKLYNDVEGSESAYAAVMFGKVGPGGHPRKDEQGHVQARITDVVVRQHDDSHGMETYNDKVFGKEGVGVIKKGENGEVLPAPRSDVVGQHRQHFKNAPPGTYAEKYFRGEYAKRTSSGRIDASRKTIDTQLQEAAEQAPLAEAAAWVGKEGAGAPLRTQSGRVVANGPRVTESDEFVAKVHKSPFRSPSPEPAAQGPRHGRRSKGGNSPGTLSPGSGSRVSTVTSSTRVSTVTSSRS